MPNPFNYKNLRTEFALTQHLQTSCGGLGETHSNPTARQLVIDLMAAGFVRHLFLELPNTTLVNDLIAEIRDLDDIPTDPEDREIMAFRIRAKSILDRGAKQIVPNIVNLSDLVLFSKVYGHNIDVWAADVTNMAQTSFPDRHQAIYDCAILKTNQTGWAGSLFLWGSDHFTQTGESFERPFRHNQWYPSRQATDTPLQLWFATMWYYIAR